MTAHPHRADVAPPPDADSPPVSGVRMLDAEERRAVADFTRELVPALPRVPQLTDNALRSLVLALAPLAELNSIAGLRGRSRDPREHPAAGGEQRDAAAALDDASDRGALTSARVAFARYRRLSTDARQTAWWLAQRGGVLRAGAIVGVEAWAVFYGRLDGPRAAKELAVRSALLASAADTKLRGLKHRARAGLTPELAAEIDAARSAEGQARVAMRAAQEELFAWAMRQFEALWVEWRRL